METASLLPTYVELSFRPNVEFISVVRQFVAEFYERIFDMDATQRVALATHELLENAVRYSCDGETSVRIEVARNGNRRDVLIRTWNRSTPANVARLEQLFLEMERDPDPFAHYQKTMRQNAKLKGGSGLGLARIRAEADMTLSFQVSGERVCVLAQAGVEGEPC